MNRAASYGQDWGAVGALLLISTYAFGQSFNARITGTVTDASGAAVPSAQITVQQIETSVIRKTTTNSSGVYDVPLLLSGTYEVKVEAAGLDSMIRRDIKLEVNDTATVDFSVRVS